MSGSVELGRRMGCRSVNYLIPLFIVKILLQIKYLLLSVLRNGIAQWSSTWALETDKDRGLCSTTWARLLTFWCHCFGTSVLGILSVHCP